MVGAACAQAFAREGLSVAVIESGAVAAGATAASMGHLLVVDGDPAEFALSRLSMQLWRDWLTEHPEQAEATEYRNCGTLWIAADEEEQALAQRKLTWYQAQGLSAEWLDAQSLALAEPLLRPGLTGALRVPGDALIYPPKAAARMLSQSGATLIPGEVQSLSDQTVHLSDGRHLSAAAVVVAAGLRSARWLPPGWLVAKKGQLAITERTGEHSKARVSHQLVELGYIKKAHLSDVDSVSFNVQPRPSGQLLIGSSRQPGRADNELDLALLAEMLRCACSYLPALQTMNVLRCWTGLRPATADGQPLIGPHPALQRVWLATGHEGLGITTSLGTARLIVEQVLGRPSSIDASPYLPGRLTTNSHA